MKKNVAAENMSNKIYHSLKVTYVIAKTVAIRNMAFLNAIIFLFALIKHILL